MSASGQPRGLILDRDSPLLGPLTTLAREARFVFFAGLPGTGKSLLVHQMAHLAHARGRRIHLLQWDVARPAFEASEPGRRYPQEAGVTHGVIRLAVGCWARIAVAQWHAQHPGFENVLIGETPFIGHRLVELARRDADAAEPVLVSAWTRFVIPVPTPDLRAHLEAERARRAHHPLHRREQEDAPPAVLRDLWRQLAAVARILGLVGEQAQPEDDTSYNPLIYQRVYEHLLAYRHAQALVLGTRLPTADFTPYAFEVPIVDVVPTPAEAARAIHDVQARHPDAEALQGTLERWYRTT
ncbi:MAG: hypothetical protein ACREKS_08050 [Candidatus Rokuibacteriota bacterium]